MIFWEEPDGLLPSWSIAYGETGSSAEVLPPTTEAGATSVGSGSSFSESGSTADENGETRTKSSTASFSSSFSYSMSSSGTYRHYDDWRVIYGTTTQTTSSSRTYYLTSSYTEGYTTETDSDGSTVKSATAFASSSRSREERGANGETGTSVMYLWTSSNGPDWVGAVITQGGWDVSNPGAVYQNANDDANAEDNGAGDAYADPMLGLGLVTTAMTSGEITYTSWSTAPGFATQLTIVDGVLQETTVPATVTNTYEATRTVTDIPTVVTVAGNANYRAKFKTCYRADRCYQLYQGGELYGFDHWCDVWLPVEFGCVSATYQAVTLPADEDDYFDSTPTSRTQWHSWSSGGVSYEAVYDTFHVVDTPVASPAIAIGIPAAAGVMHYNSLALGASLYSTYSIAVAASVTAVTEIIQRAAGFVAVRGLLTQVATLHTDDTLHVGGSGYTYSSVEVNRGGGAGVWLGDNSVHWRVGVYDYTYEEGAATVANRITVTANYTQVSPRGAVWNIAPQFVAFGGAVHDHPVVFMEQPCIAPWPEW